MCACVCGAESDRIILCKFDMGPSSIPTHSLSHYIYIDISSCSLTYSPMHSLMLTKSLTYSPSPVLTHFRASLRHLCISSLMRTHYSSLPLPLARSLAHSLTHSLIDSFFIHYSASHTHTHTHTLSAPHSLIYSLNLSLPSLAHSLAHSLIYSFIHC